MTQAKAAGVKIDFLPIHSEANGRGTMKMQIDRRMKEINDHPLKDQTTFVTVITHKTLIDHFLRNVSGVMLIDEPAEVWEQQHFDFRKYIARSASCWCRSMRQRITMAMSIRSSPSTPRLSGLS